MVEEFKEVVISQFEMIYLGLKSYFLEIEVVQTKNGIFILQQIYTKDILKRFKLESCKPIWIPTQEKLKLVKDDRCELMDPIYFKRLVGSFRQLTSTRPTIVYRVGVISRFMKSPHQSYLQATKIILGYVKSTLDASIYYSLTNKFGLVGYTDSEVILKKERACHDMHFI